MIALINTSFNHDKILSCSLLTYEVIQDLVHFGCLSSIFETINISDGQPSLPNSISWRHFFDSKSWLHFIWPNNWHDPCHMRHLRLELRRSQELKPVCDWYSYWYEIVTWFDFTNHNQLFYSSILLSKIIIIIIS